MNLQKISKEIENMNNIELFQYLQDTPGHHSDYSSLYLYLAKHPPMEDYYLDLFKGIDLKDKTFLDLGPGVGTSLDVVIEMGAFCCDFVDRDIFIGKYCENKGHYWHKFDYFQFPIPEFVDKFNLILSRGSLNVDMMNRTGFDINRFLTWLIATGERIIVIPTWDKGDVIHGEDYTCVGEHMTQYLESGVHNAFLEFGFSVTFNISNLRFPITYERISII